MKNDTIQTAIRQSNDSPENQILLSIHNSKLFSSFELQESTRETDGVCRNEGRARVLAPAFATPHSI